MQKKLSTVIILLSAFVLLISASIVHAAQPTKIWLTLTENPSTEMMVSFKHNLDSDTVQVQYGETIYYGKTADLTVKENIGSNVEWIYHIKLENLKPNTLYHYRVGINDDFSNDFKFTSASKNHCDKFSFVAMGDNRSQTGGSAFGSDYLTAVAQSGARFAINTGDLVKDGAETNEWVQYIDDISQVGSQLPVMPVIGNHDDGPGEGNVQNVTRILRTPGNNDSENRSFYSWEYGNAFFAVVTNHDESKTTQAAWLDAQLKATDALWKFVFIHEPFFTCPGFFGVMGHEADESEVGDLYFPIFAANHVDMVFSGHNHMYELFQPYNGSSFVTDPANGTMFITTGGAAEAEALVMLIEPAVSCTGILNKSNEIHFLNITIEGDDLTMNYYGRGGRFGTNVQAPVTHYTIHKDSGIDCSIVVEDGDVDDDSAVTDGDQTTDGDVVDGDNDQMVDGDSAVDGDSLVDGDDNTDGDQAVDGDSTTQECVPDSLECSNNNVMKCIEDGTAWSIFEVCGDKTCQDGKCIDTVEDGDLESVEGNISVDGDSPQTDGDDTTGTSDGGCQSTNTSASGFVLLGLLIVALVSRKIKVII